MRRVPLTIYAIVFLDALLLFAVVPLLPDYARDLSLTKTQAGVIVGAYSAAVLVASAPVGHFADRVGARRLTIFGVALLAGSTLAYAVAFDFWELSAARVGQGLSSAISWTAGLAWLSASTDPGRRGRALGIAMAMGSAGALLGPVAGGPLGAAYGIRTPFVVLGLVAAGLTLAALAAPGGRPSPIERVSFREGARVAAGSRLVRVAVGIMALVAVVSGVLETLIPLRLGQDGYSAARITFVLTLAGVLGLVTNYVVGRLFDRLGGVQIAIVAIWATAAGLVVLVLTGSALAMAVVFVLWSPPIAGQYAVAFPLCAQGADRAGIAHATVFGLVNLSWGFGFMVGPALGAAIAEATDDAVTYGLLAAATVATALWLRPLALGQSECQPEP